MWLFNLIFGSDPGSDDITTSPSSTDDPNDPDLPPGPGGKNDSSTFRKVVDPVDNNQTSQQPSNEVVQNHSDDSMDLPPGGGTIAQNSAPSINTGEPVCLNPQTEKVSSEETSAVQQSEEVSIFDRILNYIKENLHKREQANFKLDKIDAFLREFYLEKNKLIRGIQQNINQLYLEQADLLKKATDKVERSAIKDSFNFKIGQEELKIAYLERENRKNLLVKSQILDELKSLDKEYADLQKELPPNLRDKKNSIFFFFTAGFSFKKALRFNRKNVLIFLRILSLALSVIF